jgi:hypothetical protein
LRKPTDLEGFRGHGSHGMRLLQVSNENVIHLVDMRDAENALGKHLPGVQF